MGSEGPRPNALTCRHPLIVTLSLVLALLALGAAPARAQTTAAPQATAAQPSAQDRATARALMDEGRAKERTGKDVEALEAYLAADRLMGVPTTGISVGKTQIRLGQLVEAVDVLLRVTRHPPAAKDPPPFIKARQEAAALAAQLTPRIPSLRIELSGVAPNTTVTVELDGSKLPADVLSFPRKVNPGIRVVVASAPGYQEVRQTVNLAEGEEQVVRLQLVTGSSDGTDADGLGSVSPLAWAGFGIGVVGLTIGAITGGIAASKASTLDGACTDKICPPDRESDIDSMKTMAHTSTIGFVIGGLGVGVGVVSLLVQSDDGEKSPNQGATLQLSAGVGSMSLLGRF